MATSSSNPFVVDVAGERVMVPYGVFGGMYRATPDQERAIAACFRTWSFSVIVPVVVEHAATIIFGAVAGWSLTVAAFIGVVALWSVMVRPYVRDLQPIPERPPWLAIIAAQARDRALPLLFVLPLFGCTLAALAFVDATTWHVFASAERMLLAIVGSGFAAYGSLSLWLRFVPPSRVTNR